MPRVTIPNEFKCPITGDVMENPVKTVLGQTYEKKDIEQWLLKNDNDYVTKEKLPNKLLIPNDALKKKIDALQLCTEADMLRAIYTGDSAKIKELNYPDGYFNQIYKFANGMGYTFLHYAIANVHHSHPEVVIKYMIDHGADINAKTNYNNTPLHLAAKFNLIGVLKILLQNRAEIDVKNDGGNTPLHEVDYRPIDYVKDEVQACVEELLEYGANPNLRNSDDLTPYQCAINENNKELAELIAKYDVTELSRKVDYLEEKNHILEQSMETMRKQVELLVNQVKLLQNQTNPKVANVQSNTTRFWGLSKKS